MRGSLAGRVALITSAGNGIGQAIALRLAQEGAIVGVNDLKPAFIEKTVELIRAAGGVAEDLPGDASQREAVRSMVLGLAERRGRFDIIVNNAAWARYGDIASITEKTYERMTAIGFGA